tara:strand:+ start:2795 stop:3121 length:327 start_codon:yes stop_codon:yes gene_type:complete
MKTNKSLKLLKRRETLKMTHHIESLGAAFCRETGLTPSDTALVTTTDDKGTYYYFTAKPEPLDVDGLPPAMRELFDLAAALNNATAKEDADGIKACHYGIAAFFAGLG